MPQIKIIWLHRKDYGCYECGGEVEYLSGSTQDWEEVTDEELALLKKYDYMLATHFGQPYGTKAVIAVKDHVPVCDRIATLLKAVEAQEQAAKDRAEKERLRRERVKKDKALQKAAQERKTYEALKAKFDAAEPPGGWQGAIPDSGSS